MSFINGGRKLNQEERLSCYWSISQWRKKA